MMEPPATWSAREWTTLQRLIADDGMWIKPAYHPELFGLTHLGVAVAGALMRRDISPRCGVDESHALLAWERQGVSFRLDRTHELVAELGPFDPRGAVPDALTQLPITVPHSRRVELSGGVASVHIRVPVDRLLPSRAVRSILALADEYAAALSDEALATHGFADLVCSFGRAGLAAPRIPTALVPRLRLLDEWRWSTLAEGQQPSRIADYLMDAKWLTTAVPDHVTVSHGGHGINSYALTWRMAIGPVALMVQGAWGGWSGGPAEIGHLAELFAQVARVLRRLDERGIGSADGPRRRSVVIEWSTLRGIARCRRFDARTGRLVEVALDDDDPWNDIAELVGTAPLNP